MLPYAETARERRIDRVRMQPRIDAIKTDLARTADALKARDPDWARVFARVDEVNILMASLEAMASTPHSDSRRRGLAPRRTA